MASESQTTSDQPSPVSDQTSAGFWPKRWWQVMEFRIGVIPLPVYFLLLALLGAFVLIRKVTDEKTPEEISVVLAIMVVGGFTCAQIRKRLPIIRSIGGRACIAALITGLVAV